MRATPTLGAGVARVRRWIAIYTASPAPDGVEVMVQMAGRVHRRVSVHARRAAVNRGSAALARRIRCAWDSSGGPRSPLVHAAPPPSASAAVPPAGQRHFGTRRGSRHRSGRCPEERERPAESARRQTACGVGVLGMAERRACRALEDLGSEALLARRAGRMRGGLPSAGPRRPQASRPIRPVWKSWIAR